MKRMMDAYRTMPAGVFYAKLFALCCAFTFGAIPLIALGLDTLGLVSFFAMVIPFSAVVLAPRRPWGRIPLFFVLLVCLVFPIFWIPGVVIAMLLFKPEVGLWFRGESLPAGARRAGPIGTALIVFLIGSLFAIAVTRRFSNGSEPETTEAEPLSNISDETDL